jgi:hypothetical protein
MIARSIRISWERATRYENLHEWNATGNYLMGMWLIANQSDNPDVLDDIDFLLDIISERKIMCLENQKAA